jgi:hypothetical protein
LNDILGFYGASGPPPELPARAVEILKQIGARPPLYLEPGRTLEMPGLPEGAVRVHVLGPPTGEKDLHRTDPRRSESYDHSLARATALARRFLEASRAQGGASSPDAADYPFNSRYRRSGRPPAALRTLIARYQSLEEAWRTIGDDWLDQAESLALYLDEFTNNSSLVLAIELAGSGKVLLFAADAQTGNWESWAGVKWREPGVTTDDLLSRTVVYKVGHHASHNATLAPVFERLGGNNLVALIPVHKKDPNILKQNGWKMPAKNLFKRLKERTGGRVLQMDGLNPDGCDPDVQPAKGSWKRIGIKPHITDIGIEIEI